jgi:hypothetical protein
MRTFIYLLSLTGFCLFGCRRESPVFTGVPLSIYIVSEEKIDGGRFIDTEEFPKIGYIAATPDLAITRLDMVSTNGQKTSAPVKQRVELIITMRPEDAKKFTAITDKATGKRLLLMLGDTPLIAPMVRGPIPTQSIVLTLGDKVDQKKIEDGLKKLVW